jgi:hypothetical protein
MHLANWFIIVLMPGGWLLVAMYKVYTMFIQKRTHDTSEINYLLSNVVMYRKGLRHKPYVGSFIKLTDDISYVKVCEDGSLTREFKC